MTGVSTVAANSSPGRFREESTESIIRTVMMEPARIVPVAGAGATGAEMGAPSWTAPANRIR